MINNIKQILWTRSTYPRKNKKQRKIKKVKTAAATWNPITKEKKEKNPRLENFLIHASSLEKWEGKGKKLEGRTHKNTGKTKNKNPDINNTYSCLDTSWKKRRPEVKIKTKNQRSKKTRKNSLGSRINIRPLEIKVNTKSSLKLQLNTLLRNSHKIRRTQNLLNLRKNSVVGR